MKHLESCKVLLLQVALGALVLDKTFALAGKRCFTTHAQHGAPSDSCIFDVHHQFAISTKNGSSDGW